MKIRLGFVSNSSSSSYTCRVCGNEEGGYDISLEGAGMVQCVNGHVFCEGHVLEDYENPYEIKEASCPVCSFRVHDSSDVLTYLRGKDLSPVLTEIKERFGTYKRFQQWLEAQ